MNYKPIIVVPGEPNSIFLEIFFKTIKIKKFKNPIILICSKNILIMQMKKLKFNFKINLADKNNTFLNLKKNHINLINVNYTANKAFEKITSKSSRYIEKCFIIALDLIKIGISDKLLNGPISKKYFLKKKYLGITEYLAKKSNSKYSAMLIYNKKLSVSPITTHLPIKLVSKKINKIEIIKKIQLIFKFYKKIFKISPNIAVTGLNPHCESIDNFNEDVKIVKPSINYLKNKGIKVHGPFPADTIFLKNNRKKYNVIVGMYHDQVLTPLKTLHEYNAINITLGLPFMRVSPDHGPNERMLGKNLSNPLSLFKSLEFLDKH